MGGEDSVATETEIEPEPETEPETTTSPKPTKLKKLGKTVSFDSNASDGSSPPRIGDKAYELDGKSKNKNNKHIGSFRGSLSRDSGWVADDNSRDTAYVDGELTDADMVPMDEQDAEHNWDALNARILERMNQEHKWMVKHHIVHPMGRFRKRWDAVQVVFLAYVAMLVPYRICFDDDTAIDDFMFWFDVIVDTYFILDIFLSFRTAYNEPNGDLQFHPKRIASNYMRTWFLIDTAGCLPINYVLLVMEHKGGIAEDSSGGRANRTLRLLRLFRLLKLLRLLRMNRLLKKYEEEFYALKSGLKMVKIGLAVTFSCHWLGCLWYYFGTEEWRDPAEVYPDGTNIVPWTQVLWPEKWHNETDPRNSDKMTRYITSVYWSMMTITTVGYGDVHARTILEKGVAMICMIVGGFIFGLIIGALSDLSRRSNPAQKETNKKVGWLSAYMADRRVTQGLTRSIRAYFNSRYDMVTAFADTEYQEIFLQLPVDLRLELARQLRYVEPFAREGHDAKPGWLSNIPSLGGLDPLSTIMVCSRVKLLSFERQEYLHGNASAEHTIFMPGDAGYEMLIVLEGAVHAFSADGAREDVLKFADYMDEHMMLLPEGAYPRRRGAYARTDCTIGLLSSEDLQALRFTRPEIDLYVRPYVERARRRRYEKQINDVFDVLDADKSGWISFENFRDTVKKRRSYEAGGNVAEVFFHKELPRYEDFDDFQIEDLYHEIFLGAVVERSQVEVYKKLSDETGTADRSADLQVDRKAFATWWLSNQLETKDANIEKQRLQARVQVLGTRLKSMAASLATFEEFANKATY